MCPCVFRLIEDGIVALVIVVVVHTHADDIFVVGEEERCDQFGRDLRTMYGT